jgi:hypothetical protein
METPPYFHPTMSIHEKDVNSRDSRHYVNISEIQNSALICIQSPQEERCSNKQALTLLHSTLTDQSQI